MADSEKETRDRAVATLKKQAQRREKAAEEAEAEAAAVRENTARLKSLRLAKKGAADTGNADKRARPG